MDDALFSRNSNWDRRGLPAWTYQSPALFELEKSELFHAHWQIAGHISNVPNPGDYLAFDVCDERAVIVRGEDGTLRAFHNLCRHRGSRVVSGEAGTCRKAIVCPFHGWVYNFDGTLRGPARPQSYPPLDKHEFGLKPIEMEVWHGFIFVRFKPGQQPAVAEWLKPFDAELAPHRAADMVPAGPTWTEEAPVNWKSVRDVDNEGYHVAMAHPALQDLYGSTYHDVPFENGLSCAKGPFQPHAGRRWSVRRYIELAGGPPWLSEDRRRGWDYYGIFPNAVIATTPETVQFYQEFPMGVGRARLRNIVYRRPEETRRERLARYLARRIDRETYAEDTQLSIWSNESMKSSAFEGFHLSDLERGVRAHHDRLREIIPIMTLDQPPPDAELTAINARLKQSKGRLAS
jgi:carnitine monooxygenase subunit